VGEREDVGGNGIEMGSPVRRDVGFPCEEVEAR
jgi:hypothetical protein